MYKVKVTFVKIKRKPIIDEATISSHPKASFYSDPSENGEYFALFVYVELLTTSNKLLFECIVLNIPEYHLWANALL